MIARRLFAVVAVALSAAACSGGDSAAGPGTFVVPTPKTTASGRAGAATVPPGSLKPPAPAHMFAGTASVGGQLTRYCKGPCMELPPEAPDYLAAPGGSFVVFTLADVPLEAVALVRARSSEQPATVRLNPGSLMVFDHGLGTGRYFVDLVVKWRSSEARWRFGLNVTG